MLFVTFKSKSIFTMEYKTNSGKDRCRSLTKKNKQCSFSAAKGEIYCKRYHLSAPILLDDMPALEIVDDDVEIVDVIEIVAPPVSASEIIDFVEEIKCPICLVDIEEERTVTKCNHTFHKECLDIWLGDAYNCPNCRTELRERPAPPPIDLRRVAEFHIQANPWVINIISSRLQSLLVEENINRPRS